MPDDSITPSVVIDGLELYVEGLKKNIEWAADVIAEKLTYYTRNTHPWVDDTWRTRQTTEATVVKDSDDLTLIILHSGMSYDVFLELAHDGKWAYLLPAIEANKGFILSVLAAAGARVSGGGMLTEAV